MALIGLRESRTQIARARKNPGCVSRGAKSRFPVTLWRGLSTIVLRRRAFTSEEGCLWSQKRAPP